jgi:3-polyprenyl-4-hydroxybenzoate decarboxylase
MASGCSKSAERQEVETHLVVSNAAKQTILLETGHHDGGSQALACQRCHPDVAAAISSVRSKTRGMVVIPAP